jgi:hypothetical protein
MQHFWNDNYRKKKNVDEEVPMPVFSPKIPHGLTQN